MKKTKTTLNKKMFRDSLERNNFYDSSKPGGKIRPIRHLIFSEEGCEHFQKLPEYVMGSKEKLSQSNNSDIFGLLIKDTLSDLDLSFTYVVTGPTKGVKIKAGASVEKLFYGFGTYKLPFLKTIDVSGLDVSTVKDFSRCFCDVGNAVRCPGVGIVGLNTWDTSSAQKMNSMFNSYSMSMPQIILNLSNFNVEKVQSFSGMFTQCGKNSKTLKLRGVEDWQFGKQKVSYFCYDFMFEDCGTRANFSLDLSNWNIDAPLLREPVKFNRKVALKVKPPVWKLKEEL